MAYGVSVMWGANATRLNFDEVIVVFETTSYDLSYSAILKLLEAYYDVDFGLV